jgi:hypothetical protein
MTAHHPIGSVKALPSLLSEEDYWPGLLVDNY